MLCFPIILTKCFDIIYCSDKEGVPNINDPSGRNSSNINDKLTNLQNNKNEQQKGGLNENDQNNFNRQLPKDHSNTRNINTSLNKQQNVNFQIYPR